MIFWYIGSISCNSEVCFTCKVTFNKLTLICKVHNLHLRVLIENQFGEIQADCSPPTSEINCESFYSNGTITQDPKSNETIFMVQGKIDNHINGIWKCRHGTERDLAQVSVLYSKSKLFKYLQLRLLVYHSDIFLVHV